MLFKRITKTVVYFCLVSIVWILLNYQWVTLSEQSSAFDDTHTIEHNTVGIVLGTSPLVDDGRKNRFFENRIIAAVRLYKVGKVDKLLVSGSNDGNTYDEGRLMTNALIAQGVPKDAIYSDNAGFRTLDSILRARDVFKLNKFTVISQPFHNHRALYIAHHFGINAIAYNAENSEGWDNARALLREHGARILMMLDLYLLDTKPKVLTP